MRLYEPFFLHLPSLQQVISAADRDGRKTTVKFTEKAQSKSDKMNENDMSDEKNASDEDSELVEEKEYWDKEDKITESEMKNDFNLRTLYGGYYSTNSFDCYMESVAELFKNYDPSKGHLYPYLLKLFHGKLISKSRSFYYQRLYVLNYPVEIHAEADQNSPVLRTLTSKNYNKEKKDFYVNNVKTTNGERWYRIIHTYQKEKVTGYIKETPNVNFVDSSNSESIEYTNEDGETEERSDISLRQEPEPTFFWEDEN